MTNSIRLPLTFDPAALKADLEVIAPNEWVRHFNTTYYDGEWSGLALRSTGGNPRQLYPDPNADAPVADTPILDRCPNLRRVLENFSCPIRSARLLKLSPGSQIREHRDYELGFAEGEIRLHIPITTDAQVEFLLACERIEMNEGECWYLDFNQPHRVDNRSPADRIHLVIDCGVNDWLLEFFPPGTGSNLLHGEELPTPASSPEEFARFRLAVLRDTNLQSRLRCTSDAKLFVTIVTELAAEQGYRFAPSDVTDAMNASRRTWIERWIE